LKRNRNPCFLTFIHISIIWERGNPLLKKIILAAAICGALGTCTIGASDISSAQEPAREGEVTVIKGKVIETVVPKKNHRKDKRTVEKQEVKTEDKTAAKEEKTLKPAAEKTAGKTEVKKAVPAKAAPAIEAAAAKRKRRNRKKRHRPSPGSRTSASKSTWPAGSLPCTREMWGSACTPLPRESRTLLPLRDGGR
jgi:hypothetical protein